MPPHTEETTPFLQRNGAQPPTTQRLQGTRLGLIGLGIAGFVLVVVFTTLSARQQTRETLRPPPLPGLHEVSGRSVASGDLQLRTSYEGLDRTPPKAEPSPFVPPTPQVTSPVLAQATPPLFVPHATPPPAVPPQRSAPPAPVPTPPAPPQKDKPKRWLFVPTKAVGTSPFAEEDKAPEKAGGVHGGAAPSAGPARGGLIQPATWEKPADVTTTWYRSQGVHGVTTTEIVSDIQGPVVIRVTRPLQDKFLQGQVLIPQHSLMIGIQTGTPQFGASRLAVSLEQVELPDGAVLRLTAKVGDARGAQGLTGSTNHHWGRVLAGAGISALLSIGTRIPAGNQDGFAPSIAQETARDVSGSLATTGNQIVRRELQVAPTITIPAGTAVTLFLEENISLRHPPKTVK